MPIIKSAIKKLRKDRKREVHNKKIKENLKSLIKDARRNPSADSLTKVFSALDKASKIKFIHPNKSSRLKGRLSKLLAQNTKPAKPSPKTATA